MTTTIVTTDPRPDAVTTAIDDLDPAHIAEAYATRGFKELSDEALRDLAAGAIARPRQQPADSFLLHAPLELLARHGLLSHVPAAERCLVRQRMIWLGAKYLTAGDEVVRPQPSGFDDAHTALTRLTNAIDAGELDDADDAATWLAAELDPVALTDALVDTVVPRLSAAAHGSIFLYLLPRTAPRSRAAASMVRGLVRELARNPEWRLTWQEHRDPSATPGDLVEALRAPPSPGDPGSNFIFPTMSITETSGLAAARLDGPTRDLDVASATRALLRTAAQSMLQDTPDHAPYGWSHTLTMPQAVLGVASRACAADARLHRSYSGAAALRARCSSPSWRATLYLCRSSAGRNGASTAAGRE